jgi:hypothetical protein
MKRYPAILFLFMVLACLVTQPAAYAQSEGAQPGQSSPNPPGMVSPPIQILVSGCLKRGSDGGYYLSDRNGTTWQLTSDKVNLAEHVMHAVTVTGKPGGIPKQPETGNQPGQPAQSSGSPSPGLRVLTLKMLSNSCTR